MNIDELQNEWDQQFDGSESENERVLKLIKESRQSKVTNSLSKLVFPSVLFMLFNLIVIVISWIVLVEEWNNAVIAVSAAALIVLSAVVFYMNVGQLNSISKIEFSSPIIKLQQILERLKLKRVRHNRFIFVFCFLYFWLAVAVFLRWDLGLLIPAIWTEAPIVVIIHLGMVLIWFPLSLWLLRVYDDVDGTNPITLWLERGSYLTDGSLNFSLNESLGFLEELKSFGSKDDAK